MFPGSPKQRSVEMRSIMQGLRRKTPKPVRFAGAVACADCHAEVIAEKRKGYHRDLSCETCHGPAKAHSDDPEKAKPPAPRDRKFCPVCHTFNPSRPRGYPMINPVAHNPMKPCFTCHEPHDPKHPTPGLLREMPREGSALQGVPEDRPRQPRGEIRLLAVPLSPPSGGGMMDRRSFLKKLFSSLALSGGVLGGFFRILPAWGQAKEEPAGKLGGFGVSVDRGRG